MPEASLEPAAGFSERPKIRILLILLALLLFAAASNLP